MRAILLSSGAAVNWHLSMDILFISKKAEFAPLGFANRHRTYKSMEDVRTCLDKTREDLGLRLDAKD